MGAVPHGAYSHGACLTPESLFVRAFAPLDVGQGPEDPQSCQLLHPIHDRFHLPPPCNRLPHRFVLLLRHRHRHRLTPLLPGTSVAQPSGTRPTVLHIARTDGSNPAEALLQFPELPVNRFQICLRFVDCNQTVHDTPLARKLWRHLCKGDVLLGDRAFGDFVALALLPLLGVDVVARLNQGRTPDFRKPHKRNRPDDAIFVWRRPAKRPVSITEAG